jgi:secreted PhoX family phosphatase
MKSVTDRMRLRRVSLYDPEAGGGTTTLEFDTLRGELAGSWASISGTVRNCAGGPTPWASWLTCEETTLSAGVGDPTKNHGYILEVPAMGIGIPTPFKAMGRFSHEAVAVEPATGWVYETEDAGSTSGFYRFRSHSPGALSEGGILEAPRIASVTRCTMSSEYWVCGMPSIGGTLRSPQWRTERA